jgi:hypothetical protein
MKDLKNYKLRLINYFKFNKRFKEKRNGQVVIILLLIALVGLVIALAITQRSVTDLSTSTQTDQSSRAFSAAEAGIELAIGTGWDGSVELDTSGLGPGVTADVKLSGFLPSNNLAVEFPKGTNKDGFVQFWLANPGNLSIHPNLPQGSSIVVYFGERNMSLTSKETLALSINVLTRAGGDYKSSKYLIDPNVRDPDTGVSRRNQNRFSDATTCSVGAGIGIRTILEPQNNRFFACSYTIALPAGEDPIMVRIRPLYTRTSHPIAVGPASSSHSLPPQIQIITSQGRAGQSSKIMQYITQQNVVPAFLDYAIFSIESIEKD